MRHKFLVLTVKKWLKSVYIYGSYRKIKTGVPLFLDHSVYNSKLCVGYSVIDSREAGVIVNIKCSDV